MSRRTPVPNQDIPPAPQTLAQRGGVVAEGDSRLSDARTPTAHAASHGVGGSDPLTYDLSGVSALINNVLGERAICLTDNGALQVPDTIMPAIAYGIFSVEGFVKFRKAGAASVFFEWPSGAGLSLRVQRLSTNYLKVTLSGDGSTMYDVTATSGILSSTSDFYHIAVAVSTYAGTVKIWVNGTVCTLGTPTGTFPSSIYTGSQSINFGSAVVSNGSLNGWLSKGSVFNRFFSDAEVLERSKGLPVHMSDRWGALGGSYASNFTASNGNWTCGDGALTFNQTGDGTGGWLKLTASAGGQTSYAVAPYAGGWTILGNSPLKRWRLQATFYNPVGSGYAYLGCWGNNGRTTGFKACAEGSSVTVALDFLEDGNTNSSVWGVQAMTAGGTMQTSPNSSSSYYVKSISLIQIGALAVLDGPQQAPGLVLDSSTNKLHGLQSATGTEAAVGPQGRFKFVWKRSTSGFLGDADRDVLPAGYVIEAILAETSGTPTMSIGFDAAHVANRVASLALPGSANVLTIVSGGNPLVDRRLYLNFTANAAATTITVVGYIRG